MPGYLHPDFIHAGNPGNGRTALTLGDQLALQVRRNLDLIEIYVRMPYEPGASPHQAGNPATATGPAIAMLKRDIVEAVIAATRCHQEGMIKSLQMLRENR